ncbi:hypothetical protein VTJ04DRAFT_1432 [Mycothermus thermophilus]|uniref:uncharacterized protein n=1 Tax=Humicola insolens TaxID=85995 RepID=UPI0037424FC2
MASVTQLRLVSLRNNYTKGIPMTLKRNFSVVASASQSRRVTSSPSSPSSSSTTSVYPRPCLMRTACFNPHLISSPTGRRIFSTQPVRNASRKEHQEENPQTDDSLNTSVEPPPAEAKAAYPERLIIYHAGTGRTTFLACLKLTTLFVWGFFDMIMTPAYLAAGEPLLKTAGVALCGLIPAAYVAWTTTPFVAAVHIHLPPYARWSRAILERFAHSAPPNTRLDVTTMSLIGKPRVTSLVLSDLRPAVLPLPGGGKETDLWGKVRDNLSRRLGTVNYVRDTTVANKYRKWYHFRPVGEFFIREDALGNVKNGWVWKELSEGMMKRALAAEAAKGKTRP